MDAPPNDTKSCFSWERRVEFCETDAAGIVHFASLILYMEQAEHALLRSLGYSVAPSATRSSPAPSESSVTWPRVHVECDFHAPARFEDLLQIRVGIASLGSKSICYDHSIFLGKQLVATGKMTSVCCEVQSGHIASQNIPTEMRNALSRFLTN
ncbi:MAG: thioesterase family protein [Pirellula sp.]